MFVAFIKDEVVQLDQTLMTQYGEFQKNAKMLGSLNQVGSVKPQDVLATGWTELSKASTDGSTLHTNAVMYMYKVGQAGQVYKTPGMLCFVGKQYADIIEEHGLEFVGAMAEKLIVAGVTYTAEDGPLSPLQVMILAMALQIVGMDEHRLPTEFQTADFDGTPGVVIHTKQMTFNAMTYSTMLGQQNEQFSGIA